jgi:hypothetical protein
MSKSHLLWYPWEYFGFIFFVSFVVEHLGSPR